MLSREAKNRNNNPNIKEVKWLGETPNSSDNQSKEARDEHEGKGEELSNEIASGYHDQRK